MGGMQGHGNTGSPSMGGGMGTGMPGIPGGMPGIPSSSGQQGLRPWRTLSSVCSCSFVTPLMQSAAVLACDEHNSPYASLVILKGRTVCLRILLSLADGVCMLMCSI